MTEITNRPPVWLLNTENAHAFAPADVYGVVDSELADVLSIIANATRYASARGELVSVQAQMRNLRSQEDRHFDADYSRLSYEHDFAKSQMDDARSKLSHLSDDVVDSIGRFERPEQFDVVDAVSSLAKMSLDRAHSIMNISDRIATDVEKDVLVEVLSYVQARREVVDDPDDDHAYENHLDGRIIDDIESKHPGISDAYDRAVGDDFVAGLSDLSTEALVR